MIRRTAIEIDETRPLRQIWIAISTTDAAAFHVCLAYAALFRDQKLSLVDSQADFSDSPRSAWYYSRALSELKSGLNDDANRVSAGAITTIMGFACKAVRLLHLIHMMSAPQTLLIIFSLSGHLAKLDTLGNPHGCVGDDIKDSRWFRWAA